MTIEIRLAANDRELREAFALRHRTFVGEGILHRENGTDSLLFDVFDALPTSHVFVAVLDKTVIGTVRVSVHTDQPSPADEFDVPAHALPAGVTVGSGSMLCVDSAYRTGTIGLRLVKAGMKFVHRQGTSYALAAIRPEAVPLFEQLDWYQIADAYVHEIENVPVVPMAIDLDAHFTSQYTTLGR